MALSPADDDPRKPHDLEFAWAKGQRGELDSCIATFVPKPHHRGMPGFLHGGLAATALDETMASVGLVLHDQRCLTATLELRYRRAVALDGRTITVEAWRADERGGKRRYHVVGELRDGDGTVCVEAKGLFLAITASTWDGLQAGGAL
jgi:acyl-coenzyme A thioesterase PaaI-like protein